MVVAAVVTRCCWMVDRIESMMILIHPMIDIVVVVVIVTMVIVIFLIRIRVEKIHNGRWWRWSRRIMAVVVRGDAVFRSSPQQDGPHGPFG